MSETTTQDPFMIACTRFGLSEEDIEKYGSGFEQPGSGMPETRAELIAFNKRSMQALLNNPDALRELKAALDKLEHAQKA